MSVKARHEAPPIDDASARGEVAAAAREAASAQREAVAAASTFRPRISAYDRPVGIFLRMLAVSGIVLVTALFVAVYDLLGSTAPWVIYGAAALAGVLCLPGARAYRSPLVWALFLVWVMFAVFARQSMQWQPTFKVVINDVRGFAAAALITMGVVLMCRGGRHGVATLRTLWLVVFALSAPMGLWEALTGTHPLRPDSSPWTGSPRAPSSYFVNPNNYGIVLVVTIGIALLWLTERTRRWVRALLVLTVVIASGLLWMTESRSCLAGALLAAAWAALLAAQRHGHLARLARWHRRHPRIVGVGSLMLVAGAIASFIVPFLARYNPVVSMLFPGDPDTVRSDSARLALIRHGIDFWQSSPWTGIGAARYEWMLAGIDHPGVPRVIPAHNGFVELLAEHGLALAAPLALLLGMLVWRVVRPLPRRVDRIEESDPAARGGATVMRGAPNRLDERGGRYLLAVFLLGFGLGGTVVSSPLTWFPWWLFLACATATGWWLDTLRRVSSRAEKRRVAFSKNEVVRPS